MTDWLTPKTAIGRKLPCGATVVSADDCAEGAVSVAFNRKPISKKGAPVSEGGWWFYSNGVQYSGILPNLIPPTPQPGVLVTREMLRNAMQTLPAKLASTEELADALGLPPEPPKQAPWEAAYEAWDSEQNGCKRSFEAGCSWALGQVASALAEEGPDAPDSIRRRILGDAS